MRSNLLINILLLSALGCVSPEQAPYKALYSGDIPNVVIKHPGYIFHFVVIAEIKNQKPIQILAINALDFSYITNNEQNWSTNIEHFVPYNREKVSDDANSVIDYIVQNIKLETKASLVFIDVASNQGKVNISYSEKL